MKTRIIILCAIAIFILTGCSGWTKQPLLVCLESAPGAASTKPCPVYLWQESYKEPRPMAISFMRIDLHNKRYEPVVMAADDPDGTGPAEAQLAEPADILKKYGAFAAVNANAFARADNADDKPGWHTGLYVDIRGLAASDGKMISLFDDRPGSKTAFWVDGDGKVSVGVPANDAEVKNGVADWISPILTDGQIAAPEDDVRHPRTLAGIDEQGRFITLAVVDGRRKDYSDGMTLYEAAVLMRNHGCKSAVNLDGGGSSIMLYTDDEGQTIKTANRPSDNKPRPIPVMLGVRKAGVGSK